MAHTIYIIEAETSPRQYWTGSRWSAEPDRAETFMARSDAVATWDRIHRTETLGRSFIHAVLAA